MNVEILPDVSGIDRVFHYAVPPGMQGPVTVGTIVRVLLNGRRVRGYVIRVGTEAPPGVVPRQVLQAVSAGPPAPVVELCEWAAWRYAGRLRPFLLAASPPGVVRLAAGLASEAPAAAEALAGAPEGPARPVLPDFVGEALGRALAGGDSVLRLPPAAERFPVVAATVAALAPRSGHLGGTGPVLVLVESRHDTEVLRRRLRGRGIEACSYPDEWAVAVRNRVGVVVGARNAALAPCNPSAVLVLDAHSESYRSERAPTFDARVIAAERARRLGVPVVFVTPCPSTELTDGRLLVTLPRSVEREGWPPVSVIDSREEDPREGGYPGRLVRALREAMDAGAGPGRPVVLVLNTKGRARLLSCGSCRTVQRCERCGAALAELAPAGPTAPGALGTLSCPRCRLEVPALCSSCGSARLRVLRPGLSRAREQLSALLGVEVAEVGRPTRGSPAGDVPGLPRVADASVVVGTEAVLHEVRRAALVGFLDLDHELCSPRFRAAEQAFVLVARAARLAGGRGGGGRLVLRTSLVDHEVVRAAQAGAPDLVTAREREQRRILRLPPETALAVVSGDGAAGVASRLREVEVAVRPDGSYLVRAPDAAALAGSLAALSAEAGGWAAVDARVEVDPIGL